MAELAVAVSSAGKKKKLLFFLAETVRWTGWLCCWAGPVLGFGCGAALWAEAGLLRPGRVSPLPSLFLFLFSVLNLLFKFQFDFCLFLQVLKY